MPSISDASRKPATFLLTSSTAPGHFLRVLDLAQQLTSRGHRVLFKAKATKAAEVKAAGAELLPYEHQLDLQDLATIGAHSELPRWMPRVPFFLAQFRGFAHANNVQLALELEPILTREQVDCVVYDFFEVGAAWAAERAGIPWVSAGNMGTTLTRDELPLMFNVQPPLRHLGKVPALAHAFFNQFISLRAPRARLGLPPHTGRTAELVQSMISPRLHIVMAHRGLAGDIPLRDNQLFAGPTAFNVPAKAREEALRVDPGTVIISTTTTPGDNGLFRRVLEAVAPMNVPVLATSAGARDIPAGLGAHIRIEQYVPHDAVFPQARALITHGGWGTVGRALTYGLPMLVIPLFGDQILNATLVERAGLGRYLPLKKATPEAIRAELNALLADDGIRARAQRAAAEIKQLKDEQVAARALERIAFERRAGGTTRASAA
ncbi:glycosyltransferase family 1 protein [Archangium violaceum]|uniref:glycosyltransferase n=1 Tax=Archangium violaceum TaxID=83451 RepID=UPI00193AFF81|nr:glycosyltransferase [Archangium violaceum]QRK06353.1 glycosyltransferase family 1 protein [Archangium violaceum]